MRRGKINLLMGAGAFGVGFFLGGKILVGMINDYKMKAERNAANMKVFKDWLCLLYSGGNITAYFHNCGYSRIMIYGNGHIGKQLSQALSVTDIEVVSIMDKAAQADEKGMLIGTDSEIPEVDCIVITPVYYYEEIYDMLRQKTDIPIVSIQEVIDHM